MRASPGSGPSRGGRAALIRGGGLRARALLLAAAFCGPAASLPAAPQGAAPAARAPGLKVTYAPLGAEQKAKEGVHSQRARLLSLAVERGETPTPLISPGMFVAEFRGVLPLRVRDRYRFQIAGKGIVKLVVNGALALSGTLRPGKALETDAPLRLQKGDNEVLCTIESTATGEAELRVSWSGTDFAWEPISPDLWEWPADDADIGRGERMRAGQQLFVERRCARCHAPERALGESAYGELDQLAPDLRSVGARLQPGWIAQWLRNPRAVRADARMPALRFENASDPDDLAAWLATLGAPLGAPPANSADAARGEARFRELGCIACHQPPGSAADPLPAASRVPLASVGAKWRAAALEQYLLAPRHDHPHGRMPDFGLDAGDARALAAWLIGTPRPLPAPKGDAERGRRLAVRHGCDRCHQVDLPEAGRRFRDLDSLHGDHGCLDGAAGAPDFGFDAAATSALREFLPVAAQAVQRRSPLDYAERWIPSLGCRNCHGRDGAPSVWAQLAAGMAAAEPLPPEQDPVAQGVPALTWIGGKLQPGWMQRFVTGREPSPRPWLHARMPHFDARAATVVDGLVREHGYGSRDEPPIEPDPELAASGQRLIRLGEGFGCVQCHGVAGQPPVQVFDRQGIDFRVAAVRLRHEYYLRWLLDPPRIDPESRMPKFADAKGRTAFTDVLDGDARRQFEAIWHYFRTLR